MIVFKILFTFSILIICYGTRSNKRAPVRSSHHISPDCFNFSKVRGSLMEFYSPNYPKNYTKNLDCERILEAPPNRIVELDFRGNFHLEGSRCRYDFLEARDGPFGYSPLLGRYCGKEYPPLIESTQRFMWIRFKSDDVLNFGGFKAVYRFKKYSSFGVESEKQPSRKACQILLKTNSSDQLLTSDLDHLPYPHMEQSKRDNLDVDCTWNIKTSSDKRIKIRLAEIELIDLKNCHDNFIEIYDGTTLAKNRVALICSNTHYVIRPLTNQVYVRLYGKTIYHTPIIKAILTPYWKSARRDFCHNGHSCGNYECIHSSAKCNQRANCDNYSDEYNCTATVNGSKDSSSKGLVPLYVIILGAIGGFIVVVVLVAIFVAVLHKIRSSDKRLKESNISSIKSKRKSVNDQQNLTLSRMSSSTLSNATSQQIPSSPVPSINKFERRPNRPDSGFNDASHTIDRHFDNQVLNSSKLHPMKMLDFIPSSNLCTSNPVSNKQYLYLSDAVFKFEDTPSDMSSLDRDYLKPHYSLPKDKFHCITFPKPKSVVN